MLQYYLVIEIASLDSHLYLLYQGPQLMCRGLLTLLGVLLSIAVHLGQEREQIMGQSTVEEFVPSPSCRFALH